MAATIQCGFDLERGEGHFRRHGRRLAGYRISIKNSQDDCLSQDRLKSLPPPILTVQAPSRQDYPYSSYGILPIKTKDGRRGPNCQKQLTPKISSQQNRPFSNYKIKKTKRCAASNSQIDFSLEAPSKQKFLIIFITHYFQDF